MAKLLIHTGLEVETHVLNGDHVTIGRSPDNALILEDPSVSSLHAEIQSEDGAYFLRDLGSSNGTTLNGQVIQESWLNDGDHIGFGLIEATFTTEEAATNKALQEGPRAHSSPSTSRPRPWRILATIIFSLVLIVAISLIVRSSKVVETPKATVVEGSSVPNSLTPAVTSTAPSPAPTTKPGDLTLKKTLGVSRWDVTNVIETRIRWQQGNPVRGEKSLVGVTGTDDEIVVNLVGSEDDLTYILVMSMCRDTNPKHNVAALRAFGLVSERITGKEGQDWAFEQLAVFFDRTREDFSQKVFNNRLFRFTGKKTGDEEFPLMVQIEFVSLGGIVPANPSAPK